MFTFWHRYDLLLAYLAIFSHNNNKNTELMLMHNLRNIIKNVNVPSYSAFNKIVFSALAAHPLPKTPLYFVRSN